MAKKNSNKNSNLNKNSLDSTKASKYKAITGYAEDFIFNYFTALDAWELHDIVQRLRKGDIGRYFAITDLFINQGFKTIPLSRAEFYKSEDFLNYLLMPQKNKINVKKNKSTYEKCKNANVRTKNITNIWLKHMKRFYPKDKINTQFMYKVLLSPAKTQLDLQTQKLFTNILRFYISLSDSEIDINKCESTNDEINKTEIFEEIISCVDEIGFIPRIWAKEGIREALSNNLPNIDIVALSVDTCELHPLAISKFKNSKEEIELRLHNAYDVVPFVNVSEEFNSLISTFSLNDYKKLFSKINNLVSLNYAPNKQYCSICNPIKESTKIEYCQCCDTIIEYIAVNTPNLKRESIDRRIRAILSTHKEALQNVTDGIAFNVYGAVHRYLVGRFNSIEDSDVNQNYVLKKDIDKLLNLSFSD